MSDEEIENSEVAAEEISVAQRDKSPDMLEPQPQTNEEGAIPTPEEEGSDQKTEHVVHDGPDKSITVFKGKINILTNRQIDRYSHGLIKAYEAFPKDGTADQYFALLIPKDVVPRRDAESSYAAIVSPHLAYIVDSGVVYWPPDKKEKFVFIYRDNLGNSLLPKGRPAALGIKPDQVTNFIVKPMISVFQEFRDKGFIHGAIRVSNFYDGGGEKLERFMIGDCLATPPSSMQPAIYEPPHRGMADPFARGKGTIADDLYAFGVALAVMLRSEDPLAGKTDEEIIRHKMEHGSFSSVISSDRFQSAILDLLRGLLQDDPTLRWSVDEILLWSEGNRPNAKRTSREKKAPRPIIFNEKKYLYASYLAMDLQKNATDVVRMVDDEALFQWISRSLEDDEMADRLVLGVAAAKNFGSGPGYPERLASNLSIALDTNAPIRFHDLKMHGEGVGTALAMAVARNQDVQNFVKVFTQNMAMNWLSAQMSSSVEVGALVARFEAVRGYLKQNRIGLGIEKALYTLCPHAPCMSDKLVNYYVDSPEAFMNAIEDICKKGTEPALFIDRHCAAFLYTKDPKDVEAYLADLNASDYHRKILGNLGIMGSVQRRSGMGSFPEIAAVFMKMMEPVFDRYHDRETREALRKEVQKHASVGKLWKMAEILNNVNMVGRDLNAFKSAMVEYAALSHEYNVLEERLKDKVTFGRVTGKEVSAIVSCMLAIMISIAAFFSQFGM